MNISMLLYCFDSLFKKGVDWYSALFRIVGETRDFMKYLHMTFLAMLLMVNTACATDADKPVLYDESENIGFMKNPPQSLQKRFPMCDEFLKVKWIDKEKMIGYATYDAIMKGEKAKFDGERRRVWALVSMKNMGFDYDVYQYRGEERLDALFEAVRHGNVTGGYPLRVTYKDTVYSLYPADATNDDENRPLLSGHTKTVCLPYPNEQKAWIIEGRTVEHALLGEDINALHRSLVALVGNGFTRERLNYYRVLDVNFDGKNDFFYGQSLFYYVDDKIHIMKRKFEFPNFIYLFPSSNKSCVQHQDASRMLITDGKNYFFGETCNLTQMTTIEGRE